MLRGVLVATFLTVACGKDNGDPPAVTRLEAQPVPSPAGPSIPFELPARVGLPAFLSDLVPNAKRVDIAGPLGKFVVEKNVTSAIEAAAVKDDPIFRTPHPEVFVQFHFDTETRLVGIRLLAADPDFFTPGTKRWGKPDRTDTWSKDSTSLSWESSSPWTADAIVNRRDGRYLPDVPHAVLRFFAVKTPGSAIADDQLFILAERSLGTPLDPAAKTFSAVIETADAKAGDLEMAGTKQANGYVKVSWSKYPWRLLLRADTEGNVASVRVDGPIEKSGRRALFSTLRAAFGEPDAVVTEDGELAIGFPRMGEKVMLAELAGTITIMVRR